MDSISPSVQAENEERLPIAALLALAMTGFICIVTETIPAGLLTQISTNMNLTQAMVGQMVTAFALGSMIMAIPLIIWTQGWGRRNVLLLTIFGFLIFNSITAISTDYTVILIARFLAGAAAGLAWGLLAGYARRMVSHHLQGKALAVAMVGTPLALSLGVPLGTFMGSIIGWRMTFWVMSALALLLFFWVVFIVPNYPGQAANERMPFKNVILTPGVCAVLAVVVTWMLAHNILYTYIGPFVVRAGLGERVDLILMIFGLAALIGIGITSRLIDCYLRKAVLISLALFALTALVFAFAGQYPLIIYLGVAIWGLTFGGAATLLQTALADAAGNGVDVALSMNVVVWNAAIAGGGIIGGLLLNTYGVGSFAWAIVAFLILGLWIAWRSHQFGFKPGIRKV